MKILSVLSSILTVFTLFLGACLGDAYKQLDTERRGHASLRSRVNRETRNREAVEKEAIAKIGGRYNTVVTQVLAAARLRQAHPELPHPGFPDELVTVRDPESAVSHALFPAEAAAIRTANLELEGDLRVLGSLGMAYCDPTGDGPRVPFVRFQYRVVCSTHYFGEIKPLLLIPR